MKNKDFYDFNQAQSYLKDTIIRVGDEPVYIYDLHKSVGTHHKLIYNTLENQDDPPRMISVKSDKVDMNPVPLGMMWKFNQNRYETYYVSRSPVRKWKIGLSRENIDIRYITGEVCEQEIVRHFFMSKIMNKTILGIFPTINEIREWFQKYHGTIPFSRRFAIRDGRDILYKVNVNPVGKISNGIPHLFDNFFYLKEVLEEDYAGH